MYVVNGQIKSVCHYMCKKSSCRCKNGDLVKTGKMKEIILDMNVVNDAIRLLADDKASQHLTGYRAVKKEIYYFFFSP